MFLSSKSNLFLFYPKNLFKSITTNPSLRIRIVIDRYATVNQFPTRIRYIYPIPFTRNLGGLILLRFKCRSLLNGWLRQYVRLIDFEEETNKARPPLSPLGAKREIIQRGPLFVPAGGRNTRGYLAAGAEGKRIWVSETCVDHAGLFGHPPRRPKLRSMHANCREDVHRPPALWRAYVIVPAAFSSSPVHCYAWKRAACDLTRYGSLPRRFLFFASRVSSTFLFLVGKKFGFEFLRGIFFVTCDNLKELNVSEGEWKKLNFKCLLDLKEI